MAGEYSGTSVPYPEMALPALRDPVLSGPGHRALEDAVGSYHQFARSLSDAGGAVRALLTAARVAHEGEAAEASQRALRTLSEPGETGAQQSLLAARALEDQGSYVARVRADMQAADPGPTLSGTDAARVAAISLPAAPIVAGAAVVGYLERHAAREQAAEAATRYQDNTNWNLGAGFQAFPAPNGPIPDSSPGAAGAPGGGGVPAFQIGPAAALGATGGGGASVGAGGAAAAGPLPGGGTGGSPVGLVPTLPGGGVAGSAGSSGSGTGRAGNGGIAPGGAGAGVAGARGTGAAGAAGAGGAGNGGAGNGGAGNGGVGNGKAGTVGAGKGGLATGSGSGSPTPTPGVSVGPGSVGSGVGLGPQSYRPGGVNRGGIDPESGILAGAPPLPGNGVISQGDGDRRTPAWGSAVPDGQVDRAPLDRSTPQSGAPAGTAGRGTTPGQTGMPFMGGAGAAGASDREHRRPSWLVQDDPEAFWFSGLPPHSDAVITPNVDE